ncbi:hypothetical protein QR680_008370 [Steinernema hermaphroditum]|uniref:Insulin-like domain-containing protein n=1 Tax=Steinernema hermaphroditum TaxID=289476 RepID=A0AA39IHQ2_9BILA|nr:hypothetical protein QR680_008370 [Steinernema hermaphroditum]
MVNAILILAVVSSMISASPLREDVVVLVPSAAKDYIRNEMEKDMFEKKNLCGNDLVRVLEQTCKNGASLEKHDFSPEEINNIWTGCCYPGCSVAEIHLAFCK